MTREEYLQWCNACAHRAVDAQGEVICSFSGRMADFEDNCQSFSQAPSAEGAIEESVTTDSGELDAAEKRRQARLAQAAELKRMEGEQNMLNGVLAATLAGLAGAAVWAIITVVTHYQLSLLAIGLGALVGLAMRKFGKGITLKFGIVGGLIALVSCMLGNYFAVVGLVAGEAGTGFFTVLGEIPFSSIPEIMAETFELMDLLFYGLAVYQGYQYSIIKVEGAGN